MAQRLVWLCTGIMLLLLTGIMLFSGGIRRKSVTEDTAVTRKAPEADSTVYLESLADIEPGTVLDAGEVDLSQASKYFTVSKIEDNIFQQIDGM